MSSPSTSSPYPLMQAHIEPQAGSERVRRGAFVLLSTRTWALKSSTVIGLIYLHRLRHRRLPFARAMDVGGSTSPTAL